MLSTRTASHHHPDLQQFNLNRDEDNNDKSNVDSGHTLAAVTMVLGGIFGAAPNVIKFIKPKGYKQEIISAKNIGINGSIAAVSFSMLILGSILLASETPSEELTTAAGLVLLANATALAFRGAEFFQEAAKIFQRDLNLEYQSGKLAENSKAKLDFELKTQRSLLNIESIYQKFQSFTNKEKGIDAPRKGYSELQNAIMSLQNKLETKAPIGEGEVNRYLDIIDRKNHYHSDPYNDYRQGLGKVYSYVVGPALLVIGGWQVYHSNNLLKLVDTNHENRQTMLFRQLESLLTELWSLKKEIKNQTTPPSQDD